MGTTVGEGLAEVAVGAGKGVAGSVGFGVGAIVSVAFGLSWLIGVAVAVVTVALGEGETPGLGEVVSLGPPHAARTRTASVARLYPTVCQTVNSLSG